MDGWIYSTLPIASGGERSRGFFVFFLFSYLKYLPSCSKKKIVLQLRTLISSLLMKIFAILIMAHHSVVVLAFQFAKTHLRTNMRHQQPFLLGIARNFSPSQQRHFSRLGSVSYLTTEGDKNDDGGMRNEEGEASVKEARKARKAAKEAAKEAKRAKKAAQAAAAEAIAAVEAERSKISVSHLSLHEAPELYGNFATLMSQGKSGRRFVNIQDLTASPNKVWIRGRIHNVRAKGSQCFLVIRQGSFQTVQAVHFKDKANPEASKRLLNWLGDLPLESVVEIQGTVVGADVKACSRSDVEIALDRCYCVSRADILPFLLEDASRPEADVEASQNSERPFPRIGQDLRLNHRWIDLRVPANNAIMRIQSAVCQLFREYLYTEDFIEIHTPKLIAGESEGGAGVFRTDYFGKEACLAQSPQLYKQMAISADLERVFEIGPVFRAENSNTRRHLCEFTGLDLEMAIGEHYDEILTVVHSMFKYIFEGLEQRYASELAVIREQYASKPVVFSEEPCVIHWPDGIAMLRDAGVGQTELGDFDDLSTAQEILLGALVKEKFGTDFFIMDRYPSSIRPFYTMPCEDDSRYSNSYDMFIRGQEICSGAQRCHDPSLLRHILTEKGIDSDPLVAYINSFEHGVSPHGGAGIGLERVVFLYLGLDNVRKASMFPRDPSRCTP